MRVPNNIADPSVAARRIAIGSLLALHALAVAVIFLRLPIHNADDIWNVELWGAWRPFSTEILIPRDTYVLHAPINIAARLILGDGLASLAAATVVLNAIGFALTLNFIGFVARRSRLSNGSTLAIQVLVGLLYAFVSIEFTFLLARPNYRNLELGLFLLAVQLVITVAERARLDRRTVVGVGLVLGLFSFNDPMFLICGLAPCLAFIAIRWLTSNDTTVERRAAVLIIGGIAGFGLLRIGFGFAGIQISDYAPPIFSSLTDIPRTAAQSLELLLLNFGATFSNRDAQSPGTLFNLARLALLGVMLFGAWRFRRDIPQRAHAPLGAVAIFVVGVLLASTFSSIGSFEGQNSRYLIPAAGMVIVLAVVPLAYGAERFRRVLAAAILVLTAAVGLDVVRHARGLSAYGAEAPQFDVMADLADELDRRGPSTGYGVFWVALPVQYFGGSDVTLTSVECDVDGDPLVANFANLDIPSSDADRSFFVLWDRPTAQCSRDQITEAFGMPVDEERFELDDGTWGHFTVFWFDGNIGADIGRAD